MATYETEAEAGTIARSWLTEIGVRAAELEDRRREAARSLARPGVVSLPSDLGDPWAERDALLSEATYSPTSRTSRIRNGEGILYVGPQGCGKTADYIHLTTECKSTPTRLMIGVKLTDADLISLRGIAQELFPDIDRHNIYRHIWRLVLTGLVVDEYHRLKEELASLEHVNVLDQSISLFQQLFGVPPEKSLAEMVDSLVREIDSRSPSYTNSQELIRSLSFPEGRPILAAALQAFEIRLAIDGLDQGWDPTIRDAVDLLVALIDEAHALEQQYRPRLKVSIFALQEVYRDVSLRDRDRDKRSVEYYSWDKDQLADMVGARILAVLDQQTFDQDPRRAWSLLFEHRADAPSSFDYIVERSLMRPRHVLRFCREALLKANNRRHLSVHVSDVMESEELYSEQLIYDLSLEYGDRFPGLYSVILQFLNVDNIMPYAEFRDRINSMFATDEVPDALSSWLRRDSSNRVLDALRSLYEVGFVGVVEEQEASYSYLRSFERVWPRESTQAAHGRRIRRRRRRRGRHRARDMPARAQLRFPDLVVHPAFHKALDVQM